MSGNPVDYSPDAVYQMSHLLIDDGVCRSTSHIKDPVIMQKVQMHTGGDIHWSQTGNDENLAA